VEAVFKIWNYQPYGNFKALIDLTLTNVLRVSPVLGMRNLFPDGTKPIPYNCKGLFAFQYQNGKEVCFFSFFVQVSFSDHSIS